MECCLKSIAFASFKSQRQIFMWGMLGVRAALESSHAEVGGDGERVRLSMKQVDMAIAERFALAPPRVRLRH